MDVKSLSRLLELPEVHRQLLAGYGGPYSMGIGQAPDRTGSVVVLHVSGEPLRPFPDHLDLLGEVVPVVVKRDFVAPAAYQGECGTSS